MFPNRSNSPSHIAERSQGAPRITFYAPGTTFYKFLMICGAPGPPQNRTKIAKVRTNNVKILCSKNIRFWTPLFIVFPLFFRSERESKYAFVRYVFANGNYAKISVSPRREHDFQGSEGSEKH